MKLNDHIRRQMAFSKATFGPGDRQEGVVDHIRRELDEVIEGENDPKEWVDLVLLSLDGLWRSIQYNKHFHDCIAKWEDMPEECTKMIQEKQSKNEQRDWPDWRNADPKKAINHDRSKD